MIGDRISELCRPSLVAPALPRPVAAPQLASVRGDPEATVERRRIRTAATIVDSNRRWLLGTVLLFAVLIQAEWLLDLRSRF